MKAQIRIGFIIISLLVVLTTGYIYMAIDLKRMSPTDLDTAAKVSTGLGELSVIMSIITVLIVASSFAIQNFHNEKQNKVIEANLRLLELERSERIEPYLMLRKDDSLRVGSLRLHNGGGPLFDLRISDITPKSEKSRPAKIENDTILNRGDSTKITVDNTDIKPNKMNQINFTLAGKKMNGEDFVVELQWKES